MPLADSLTQDCVEYHCIIANRLFQPFTLYPIVCSSVRTRSACVPWISNPSSVIVPPAPHAFFRRFRSDGRSVSSAVSPRITVIMRPCLRFSTAIRAVCFPGGVRTGASGGQVHSDSGFSHRSQCGGRSNFVPVNRPILESLLLGILCPRIARIDANSRKDRQLVLDDKHDSHFAQIRAIRGQAAFPGVASTLPCRNGAALGPAYNGR